MHDKIVSIRERGSQILGNPLLNKGTAFTTAERDALGLNGLLPSHVSSIDEQIKRSYINFQSKQTPLGKYSYLTALLNRNELLFYQLVSRHIPEMLPVIYTPTVGEGATNYSQMYSQRRGFYVSYPLRDKIEQMFDQLPDDVDVAVVTDGERILGLGDQGIGGMTIPIGKLALYTLFGGIHPGRVLPVLLDVGTNNPDLLNNDLYLGWRHPRMKGAEYSEFVDRFVRAFKKRFPKALLQWEDFGKYNARPLLDRYRKELLSFNDDIQGTAAVVHAALLSALHVVRQPLDAQRIMIMGAGSAGLGIAETIVRAIGTPDAHKHIFLIDRNGLVRPESPNIDDAVRMFAKSAYGKDPIPLKEAVAKVKPTVLIGVCAQGGVFTQEIIEEMHKHVARPIIFPLSNPTSKSEAVPQDLITWTKGTALIATGSPFPPAEYGGNKYPIAQCNNVFIFPGVGLGSLVVGATQVTDGMFLDGAKALATLSPAISNPTASLFPSIEFARKASQVVALAVAKRAFKDGVAHGSDANLEARIAQRMWEPTYPTYVAG